MLAVRAKDGCGGICLIPLVSGECLQLARPLRNCARIGVVGVGGVRSPCEFSRSPFRISVLICEYCNVIDIRRYRDGAFNSRPPH